MMQALEIDTTINEQGDIHLSEEYRSFYGKRVRLIVLLPDSKDEVIDPMIFSGKIAWPMDGLVFQKALREA